MFPDPIFVAKSKFGRGVFAARNIKAGELICTMKGKKISSSELGQEATRDRDITVDPLQIARHSYLLVEEPYLFVNHSCEPNAGLKNSVELVSIKNIKKNSEIFFDYSTTWYDGMECNCGSKSCRKHISDYFSIPEKTRNEYRKLGIVPDFIPKES